MMAKTQKLSELSQSFSFTEYNPIIIILVECILTNMIRYSFAFCCKLVLQRL